MDKEKLLDDLNSGLQALVREELSFPVAEELPPLANHRDFLFAGSNIQPPTTLYVTHDEFIRVTIWHNDTTATFTITARVMTPDGRVRLLLANADPDPLGFFVTVDLPRISGALLSLSVSLVYNGSITVPVYAVASVVAGGGTTAIDVGVFATGYVTTLLPLVWPWASRQPPGDGPGTPRALAIGSPAAGNNITIAITSFTRWVLRSATFSMTCSAAVANRRAEIIISDGTSNVWLYLDTIAVTAGQTRLFFWGQGAVSNSAGTGGVFNLSIPPILMGAGWQVVLAINGIQAADQISGIVLYVDEWIVP